MTPITLPGLHLHQTCHRDILVSKTGDAAQSEPLTPADIEYLAEGRVGMEEQP